MAVHDSKAHELAVDVTERDGQMADVRLTLRLDPKAPETLTALDIEPRHIARLELPDALAGLATRARTLADADSA